MIQSSWCSLFIIIIISNARDFEKMSSFAFLTHTRSFQQNTISQNCTLLFWYIYDQHCTKVFTFELILLWNALKQSEEEKNRTLKQSGERSTPLAKDGARSLFEQRWPLGKCSTTPSPTPPSPSPSSSALSPNHRHHHHQHNHHHCHRTMSTKEHTDPS